MKCAIASGAMDLFVTMLQDDSDPLVQMSMLDLVEKMASTTSSSSSICITHCYHRATWLLTPPGVVEPVLKMAGGMSDQDDCEPDAILGGSALRIVAALCKLAHYQREPDDEMVDVGQEFMMTTTVEGGGGGTLNLVACFHRALHKFAVTASGELDRLALIDAISSFAAASASAMDLVLNDEVTKQAWLSLAVAQPHLKSAILMSVAMVLDPSRSMLVDATNDDVDSLLRRRPDRASAMKLYSSLGQVNHDQDPTSLLLSMTRSTLVETRLAAYAMFTAMAKLPDGAGCQVLFSHASFLDFCLTRRDNDIERMSQDCREGKFAIVQAIAQNQVIMGLLAPEIVARIELYIKQGPHHFQAARSWELATDQ
jgi:Proteasome non-ATPase 26S subunit